MTTPSPSLSYDWTFPRVAWATLVFVLVALGFWLVYRFHQVVFILFITILIGTVIRPLITWMQQHRIPRIAGVILVYLLFLALFIGLVLLLFPLIAEQSATITSSLPGYYQSLRGLLVHHSDQLIWRTISESLPSRLPDFKPIQQTGQEFMDSAGLALGYVTSAIRFIFILIVILFLSFYWTLDGPRIIQSFLLLLPQGRRESIRDLISAMEAKVGYYIAGQGVLCLMVGVMALVSYLLIGLPNALVLALIAGVLEAVPMIGPLLGAVPAALVALSLGPDKLIWVIVASVIIQQLENSLLVPRVMRKAVGVNPFVTLLAIFAFSSFFGIAGALMAIPMAAIIQLALNHFVFYPQTNETETSDGRDYASRLRYEAQDLAQDLRKQARLEKGGSDLRVKQIDKVMDEIETITTDLDALLAQVSTVEAP